ncbi:MAG: hypothetical protein ACO30M_04045 [Candidatus Kapaibacteriota bacterium]
MNVIELLMMPGIGMIFGAIPIEDLIRKRNRFEALTIKQSFSAQVVHAGLSMIAAFIGMMIFGTFSAAAIGATMTTLFSAFNPFARFRHSGIGSAFGAALAVSPFPILLFALMYATGYGVLGKKHAIGMMSGILGTMLLAPTTPHTILKAFEFIPFRDISEHSIFVIVLGLTLFMKNLPDIRIVVLDAMKEKYSDED